MAHSVLIRASSLVLVALITLIIACQFLNVSPVQSTGDDESPQAEIQTQVSGADASDDTSGQTAELPTPQPVMPVIKEGSSVASDQDDKVESTAIQAQVSDTVKITAETPTILKVAERCTDTTESETLTTCYQTMSEEDGDRFDLIKNRVLSAIPTGRKALQLMEEYDVRVEFGWGPGSFYIGEYNLIVINSNKRHIGAAALTFVHEMLHATRYHQGMRVDLASHSKEEYVAQMIEEEAEGFIWVITAMRELEAIRISFSYFGSSYPPEDPYMQAYEEAVASAKAENGDIAEEELKTIGREAGKQGIVEALMAGYLRISITEETYPFYYGQHWDRLNQQG